MPALLDVRNLNIDLATAQGRASAVRDVSFYIEPGEVLGVVGKSGSGKSVTALSLLRLLPQAVVRCSIQFSGKELLSLSPEEMRQIRGAGISMIFQEPMTALNPVMRVREQIAEAVLAHASGAQSPVGKAEAWRRAVDSQVAHRISVMYAGSVVETASAAQVFAHAAHPYTRGLLNSVPTLRSERSKPLRTIEGTVPASAALPPGCAFEPRCSSSIASCALELPPLVEVAPGHFARCPVVAREAR